MNKFDEVTEGSFQLAHKYAIENKNTSLTEHHLLLGFINNPASIASKHLQQEKSLLEGVIESEPKADSISLEIKPAKKLHEWITLSSASAVEDKRQQIQEYDFLKNFKKFFPNIELALGEDDIQGEGSPKPDFLTDLNELAEKGKLDPVIGRSQEIRKIQEILCRRTKNNPVLIGSPGVGKTAIVDGLAGLIVSGNVPDIIRGKTIYSLDIGSLIAGTQHRGDFEEKLKNMLQFLKKQGNKAILFVDELHLLIGAGKTSGAIDAANLLKPSLARGEIYCIGSTTFNEYKEYIESDAALERRFHKILVEEPSEEESIQIILGLKEKLEIHHGIEITDEAIIAAVQFSTQYITERFLPDKAIDLIDEAAAALKLSADSMPPEIQELEALIRSKKILLKSQHDSALEKEIGEMESRFGEAKEEWQKKNIRLKELAQYKKKLDELQFQSQKAEQDGNLNLAAQIKHGQIPELQAKIDSVDVSWKLNKDEVAEVVAKITAIPKENILKTNYENLTHLEDSLKQTIFGQDKVITEIAEILLSSYLGLADSKRPLGSFLLLGPSGVGKTETAKAIASCLFHSKKNIVRIDLSEYSEMHSVAKLIGSPPGYIGYEKGGLLTEAIRKKSYSVVLFDEIEKAHPNFSDILLQILDEGRLADTQGNIANFKNTIIFITSNLKEHKSYLKPEVIGRLDSILYYQVLSKENMQSIIDKETLELNQKLREQKIQIQLEEALIQKIIAVGFDEKYGARPLKSAFKKNVIFPVAKKITSGSEIMGGNYILSLQDDETIIKKI